MLAHYSDSLPLILTCDATPFGVSIVLSYQLPSGQEAPVTFYSHTLSAAKRNYSKLDREVLVVVAGVQ